MRVCIIGGGIIGLFTAYYLLREGIKEITIYEKDRLGSGSVHAAGLIEPYRFDKINSMKMIIKMIKYYINKSTKIKEVDKEWLKELLRTLGKEPPNDAWELLKNMALYSLSEYERFAEEKNDFDFEKSGLLEIHESLKELELAVEEEKRSPFSNKFEVVDIKGYAGAIYFPDLSKLDTEKFIKRIVREIDGVKVINDEVIDLNIIDGSIITKSGKNEKYDEIVLSAGIWCKKFVPITSFKGYGIVNKARSPFPKPAVLAERGIAIVENTDNTKITFGFDADFSSIHDDRLNYFYYNLENIIKEFKPIKILFGFRPCSPDGFPIIGKKHKITIATGACRLGWSYAPAIGYYAVQLVLNRIKDYGYISRYWRE